jgi:hypothetical protein
MFSRKKVICSFTKNMWKLRIGNVAAGCIFTSVFHRILDFKTGQDFHPALFLFSGIERIKLGKTSPNHLFLLLSLHISGGRTDGAVFRRTTLSVGRVMLL